jgi:hypothetical protein
MSPQQHCSENLKFRKFNPAVTISKFIILNLIKIHSPKVITENKRFTESSMQL